VHERKATPVSLEKLAGLGAGLDQPVQVELDDAPSDPTQQEVDGPRAIDRDELELELVIVIGEHIERVPAPPCSALAPPDD